MEFNSGFKGLNDPDRPQCVKTLGKATTFFNFMPKLAGDLLGCSLGHMVTVNYDSNSQRRYITTLLNHTLTT